jgi:hypothetical protein
MLNFFKRPATGTELPAATPTTPDKPSNAVKPAKPPDAPAVPEVMEGNEDSDWALWEDSVAFQDSQMPSDFGALKAPEIRETPGEKPADDHDPFGAVRRRAP